MTSVRLPATAVAPLVLAGGFVLAWLVGLLWGDGGLPWPIVAGRGFITGSSYALVAVGLVLIYRASRIINFAQAGFGVLAAMLYLCLASLYQWPWFVSFALAILGTAAAGVVVEMAVIRRFARAPRLVLTVVTIALAQAAAGLTLFLPRIFGLTISGTDAASSSTGQGGISIRGTGAANAQSPPGTPFERISGEWGVLQWNGDDLVTIITAVAALAALVVFFRYTSPGVAVRGAAENTDRALLLGVNVSNLSSLVWGVAAALAAVASILTVMNQDQSLLTRLGGTLGGSSSLADAVGATLLLRALAAAVIGRMENLPVAVASAFAVAVVEWAVFATTGQSATIDAALLVVIVVSLLVQRARGGRQAEAETSSSWEATEEIRPVPTELARLPMVRSGIRRALWLVAIVVAAYPWVMSPAQTSLGGIYAIYGIVAVSLVILTGWAGQISLGQFGFVGVGALVGGSVTGTMGLPFPVALLIGSGVGALVAVGLGLPALRIKGLFLAVTTLAFAVTTSSVLMNRRFFGWLIPDDVSRPSFAGIDTTDERSFYYLCVICLAAAVFVTQSLRRSRTGRLLITMRDNEAFAQSYGINLVRTRLTAFAVSGFMAGFAGVLYVHHQQGITVASYGPEQSIQMFLMAVIGGLGNTYTVLAGALYLGTTTVVIDNTWGQLLSSAFGVLAILFFFPQGLGSLVYRARDAWLRRIALRNRIPVPSLLGERRDGTKVVLAERLTEQGDVPDYALASEIGTAGRSQLTRVWRYD